MAKIAGNTIKAQAALGIKDTVWVPFGMGAFQRNLNKLDPSFNDPMKLYALKKQTAAAILSQLALDPKMTMHLCLPTDRPESIQNYNAFIEVLEMAPEEIKKRVKIHINWDAAEVAQELANQKGNYKVGLVNGANRDLLGHVWTGDHAKNAIDENLHRRSPILAGLSLLLNGGTDKNAPKNGILDNNVIKYGGRVLSLG